MITLFIDTSNRDVSIAIIKDKIILAKKSESMPQEHSVYTVSYIDDVLIKSNIKATEIDNIMVVNGPGSFTGIRIGLTVAKTYAYLLKKDLILLSSLKVLALSTKSEYILAVIDAKHDNYYYGLYNYNYSDVIEEQFNTKEELNKIISNYDNITIISNSELDIPNTKIITNIDLLNVVDYYQDKKEDNIHLAKPNYLKLPQAMEK